MKKILVSLMILALLGLGFGKLDNAYADVTTDTFQITITVNYISIALLNQAGNDYVTWAIGQVAPNTPSTMNAGGGGAGDQGVRINNTSNFAINLSCYATNTAGWTLATAAGNNTCILQAKGFGSWEPASGPDMSGAVAITNTAGPGNGVDSGVAANTDRYWYFRLHSPTEVTANVQNTFTVTVRATGA